jgi:hypothetical protein
MLTFVIVSTLGAGFYYAATSPKLSISKIEVRGTSLLNSSAVEADAWGVIKSNHGFFGKYHNILIFSKSAVARKIMRQPEVRAVRIGRILPSTVVINVEEKHPAAIVTNGTVSFFADETGLLFHKAVGKSSSVPIVLIPADEPITASNSFAREGLAHALKCFEYCSDNKLKIDKISIDQAGNLCLNIGSDFYVKMGQPVQIKEKVDKLSQILNGKPELLKEAQYIDVSCPERAVFMNKSSGVGGHPQEQAAGST